MAGIGHNSIDDKAAKLFVERVERLVEQRADVNDDIRDVWLEAKSQGHDVRALKEILRMRKIDPQVRQERQDILDVYLNAFGMI